MDNDISEVDVPKGARILGANNWNRLLTEEAVVYLEDIDGPDNSESAGFTYFGFSSGFSWWYDEDADEFLAKSPEGYWYLVLFVPY